MNETGKPQPTENQIAKICSLAFVIGGVTLYEVVAPSIFGNPVGHVFNLTRVFGAAVVGAVSAIIGYGAGKVFQKIRG